MTQTICHTPEYLVGMSEGNTKTLLLLFSINKSRNYSRTPQIHKFILPVTVYDSVTELQTVKIGSLFTVLEYLENVALTLI